MHVPVLGCAPEPERPEPRRLDLPAGVKAIGVSMGPGGFGVVSRPRSGIEAPETLTYVRCYVRTDESVHACFTYTIVEH